MKNLAAVVTKEVIIKALNKALKDDLKLNPSTKFHIVYRDQVFPPKEIIRLAAKEMGIKNLNQYRLAGGASTNKHLQKKGFEIVQFAEWKSRISDKANSEWKIVRLTFNTNGWAAPSGTERKSKAQGLHEADYGFGHEEWLFDFSKKIRGFKYGFIEGFRTKNNKHKGSTFNLQLFTIDNIEREKYWAGTIENCYVLTVEEQDAVVIQFSKNGWLKEKEKELKDIGLWQAKTKKSLQTFVPNVRFTEDNVTIFDVPIPVEHNRFIDSRDRYRLYDWNKSVEIPMDADLPFSFIASGPNQNKKVQRVANSNFQSKEIKQLHRKIAAALYQTLLNNTAKSDISCDLSNTDGTYIDMVKKEGDQYTLFEIKTYTQLRKNIREATGQLLEYAFWTRNKKIKEITIVSEKKLDKKAEDYLNLLQNNFKLPLSYLHQKI
jgi:hypothetical protein